MKHQQNHASLCWSLGELLVILHFLQVMFDDFEILKFKSQRIFDQVVELEELQHRMAAA